MVLNKDGGVLFIYLSANFYVTSFDQEAGLMLLFQILDVEFDFVLESVKEECTSYFLSLMG